ncbi:hypothetical protein HHL16_12900 [Pseudoflavitalea sp. G-6-1-2]|uniref:hypothetical protein n=1 Tax=Pseudoflavitalea sp. G-6-1-2 TaxID=2728841 RepID=UPI00146EE882|nr:hypothetical protein [Pseudoflavitalea sp. G-6-1-2]NML21782.1 hypothetical protein [Pseudoflavitalea sp. G-6-1-2]
MKRIVAFLACAFAVSFAAAQQSNGLANPESIISDGKFLYVTNIGKKLEPVAKDGDGSISKLSLNGDIIEANITKEILNAPKGTAIIKGVLYVADIDRIVGIELSTGNKVKEIDLAKQNVSFANDLEVKNDHTLFLSETVPGSIIEVDLNTEAVTTIANVKGANGICYDAKRKKLYTCSFVFEDLKAGVLGVITWSDNKPVYEAIGAIGGAFDGLALLNDHTLLVSEWSAMDHAAGSLWKIDLQNSFSSKIELPAIGGPADFYFDAKQKKVFIPALLEGKMFTYSF